MVIRYRKTTPYKYQLLETGYFNTGIDPIIHRHLPFIDFLEGGRLIVYSGYSWDGPSGPAFDTKNFMRPSLVHDALYQMIREGVLPVSFRSAADDLLRDMCIEDGMSKFRAFYVHKTVRLLGGFYVKPSKETCIYEAP
jgi:hypothetical protein